MKTSISLKRAVQSMVLLLIMTAIALVWPLKIIRPMHAEGAIDENSMTIISNEATVMQGFVPLAGELSSVSFYIYNEELTPEEKTGRLVFRLFDANMQKIEEKSYVIDKLTIPGTCRVTIGSDLQIGQVYYFTVENPNVELLFSMRDGVNLDTRYEYRAYFTKGQYAVYALCLLSAGALLFCAAECLLRKNTCQVRADWGLRAALSVFVTGAAVWGLWNVIFEKKFSENWEDILFYGAGILLFLLFSLYSLLFKREALQEEKISQKELAEWIRTLLQSLAFAGVMHGGIRYLNALSSKEQKLASNYVLACFAIAIICGYTKKEIVNWYHAVYLVFAIGGGIYYLQQNKADLENWEIYKGNALYFILCGILILNTVRILIWDRKERSKVSKVYTAAFAVLIAWMVINRNGRVWPIDIAVFWGIFAIRIIYKGGVQQYLKHFSNGVLIHFVCSSIYAMLYRPFHNFIYTRYPGVFHTVTMTAVYMVFVLVLAVIRFMAVYKEKRTLKAAWKELWLIGMSASFLLLTVSRTGLFAAFIICPAICVLTTVFQSKDGIIGFAKRVLLLVITGVCFFPIVFTACRIVPAVVGNPFTYEIEWFQDSIKKGEEWDSFRFITVSKFFGFAHGRIGASGQEDLEETPEGAQSLETAGDKKWEEVNQYSNGRLDIYKLYLNQLNWEGHETVSLKTADGHETGHAHNVLIQVAHDFGIGAGIFFILFCVFAGIKSIFYFMHHKEESTALIPLGVLAVFGICGLVEWVFLPYIPTGFGFLLVLALMIPSEKRRAE